MAKWVYLFKEGNAGMRELLGGKGCNLAEMTQLGLPIPQGFTITTEACNEFYRCKHVISEEIQTQILEALSWLENETQKKFGDEKCPLLVSVRSGARTSMPGMMDTILNLGLNDQTVEALAEQTRNRRFAFDSYRRFIQMFSDVVMQIPKEQFENLLENKKKEKNVESDMELEAADLEELVQQFKQLYCQHMNGKEFPQNPVEQLFYAIYAVFRSWDNPRAIMYRRINAIPSEWGTAVNIQEMVFGNKGETSGTGVAFTRNPSTGEKGIFGEYLINAQGEDVVAGIRTPHPIAMLERELPECYHQFIEIAKKLENHFHDMQDMEFTIEDGKLFFLQTRNGKRTAMAAIQIACDLVEEGQITEQEAVSRIDAKSIEQLLHPMFSMQALREAKQIGTGLPASPGAAAGRICFSSEEAKRLGVGGKGERIILVRSETSPEDIEGMNAAQGILTKRGGMTSHAAVVARGMGKCCICGCEELTFLEENRTLLIGNEIFHEGDYISLNGSTGKIYEGDISTIRAEMNENFKRIMQWADIYRTMEVRTNADTPEDTIIALQFGAQGIGLCRTEHMFFDEERISKMRKMILSDEREQRESVLAELLVYQKEDFKKMYKVLEGKRMTIRFLDPPLHEFLPTEEEEFSSLAQEMNISPEQIKEKCNELRECNPMMGHRGCRLLVTYPEVAIMQTRAVMEAAIEVSEEFGYLIRPEIMIPFITERKELLFIKELVTQTAERVKEEKNFEMDYKVGTMIETPRAAVLANEIAKEADFFSFGTNDLTQLTFGFSRDDAAKFLDAYYQQKILESDPFARLDQNGVGQLIKIAVEKARAVKADIELGMCGEHAGDPKSIAFCQAAGLNYISCSPYRVPIARLAAAQAAIAGKNE